MDEQFCYRCGEKGHFVAKCQNPENQSKVIRKLIRTVKTLKESLGTSTSNATDTDCHVKQGLLTSSTPAGIPEGLIGPPSIVPLKVNGQPCDALFDSGSQVTIIFQSWYKAHVPSIPVHLVTGLNIWGESNISYPYLGYVVVDVEYPAEVTGTKHTVPVLALICPSPKEEQIPVTAGTNTSHVHNLVQECRKEGRDITKSLGIQIHRESLPTFTDSLTLSSRDETASDERSENEELQLEDGGIIQDRETEQDQMVAIKEEYDQNEEDDEDSAPEPDLDPRTACSVCQNSETKYTP